jgi:hypothetical protein
VEGGETDISDDETRAFAGVGVAAHVTAFAAAGRGSASERTTAPRRAV